MHFSEEGPFGHNTLAIPMALSCGSPILFSAPRATIFNALFGNGRCKAAASFDGARIHTFALFPRRRD
jgi:hypothetical protein